MEGRKRVFFALFILFFVCAGFVLSLVFTGPVYIFFKNFENPKAICGNIGKEYPEVSNVEDLGYKVIYPTSGKKHIIEGYRQDCKQRNGFLINMRPWCPYDPGFSCPPYTCEYIGWNPSGLWCGFEDSL